MIAAVATPARAAEMVRVRRDSLIEAPEGVSRSTVIESTNDVARR